MCGKLENYYGDIKVEGMKIYHTDFKIMIKDLTKQCRKYKETST